jgi:arylsulfatase A-like enzyme
VKPNVFFLVIDSLRADAAFGDHIHTPNFASHVASGASFRQCICTTTTTTPSFSSMLTGTFPPKHGVRGLQGYRLSPAIATMAESFAEAGYQTHAEVTGPLVPETGVLRGFADAQHRPAYNVPFFGWRDEIVDKIRSYDNPWFMLLHIWEVHRPYRSPPDFAKRKDRAGYEAAVAATDEWLAPVFEAVGENAIVVVTGDHGESYPETEFQLKQVKWARSARRKLKLGNWFPYLDNKFAGMEIGHGFALFEHLVRVPLIVSGPGVTHATVHDQVRHVDLLPTLADLAGLDLSVEGLDGRSIVPLMRGDSMPEEPAYLEAVGVKLEGSRIYGARTPGWKLLKPGDGNPVLYRLDGGEPPDEKTNVYSRHLEIARDLEAFIERVNEVGVAAGSGMTTEEEAVVEQHLRDLGYL